EPSLTARTAWGFSWSLAQVVVSKGLALASQLVLAWLLVPGDFGLVSLALSVAIFINLLRDAGIRQILIHRQHTLSRWVNPAFWMSGTLGLLAGALMALAAPIAGRVFGEPRLPGLILVLAVAAPPTALGMVPEALCSIRLQFRLLSVVTVAQASFQFALSVLMAWAGYGPYSMIVPLAASAVLRAAVLLVLSRPMIGPRPHLRLWRHLVGDSGTLLAS